MIAKLKLGHLFDQFRQPAAVDVPVRQSETIHSFLEETRRELAVFASEMMGAQSFVGQFGRNRGAHGLPRGDRKLFRDLIEETWQAKMIVDPRPGLHIVDINDAYAAATLTRRGLVAGERLFDVFPDNPGDPTADGVSNLYESLQKAAQTGECHVMQPQRYDVRDAEGRFVTRYWQCINTPIFDEEGRLVYIVHSAGQLPER